MPTHTPSPHRFLATRPTATSTPKPSTQSNLRHGFTAQTQTPKPAFSIRQTIETQKVTPAKRFVVAPTRGAEGGTRGREDDGWTDANAQTSRAKPAKKLRLLDIIDEGSPSPSPLEQDDEGGVAESIEQMEIYARQQDTEGEDDEDAEMLFTPHVRDVNHNKRRRVSPAEPSSPLHSRPVVSTSMLAQSQQQPPRTPAPTINTHRFLISTPRTPQLFSDNPNFNSSTTTTTPGPNRPHFILPPQHISPPKATTPLPETFSPSRKGQKYTPDGLAATLQSWIVETATTGYAAQTRDTMIWGREKDDGVKMKVRVISIRSGSKEAEGDVECYPGGVVFVSGTSEQGPSRFVSDMAGDDATVRVMLAGQGGARGAGGVRVRTDSLLGIRAPVWDVDLGGVKWVVGVDWLVL